MATYNGDANPNTYYGASAELNILHGNGGADYLIGGYFRDQIYGGDEGDTLDGDEGDDYLSGGNHNDYLYGGSGHDFLQGDSGDDVIHGEGDDDEIYPGEGFNTIYGGNGREVVSISDGSSNTIFLEDGNDMVYAWYGSDNIDGGTGQDLVSYFYAPSGVTVNLRTGVGSGVLVSGDTYKYIEDVDGSNYADFLIGNGVSNVLQGLNGDDRIQGGYGADFMDGGANSDILDYLDSTAGVTINLATGDAFGGYAEGDQFWNFEQVYGSQYADALTGTSGNDWLYGWGGHDGLVGGAGSDFLSGGIQLDRLIGGAGSDILWGGTQADRFIYTAVSDTPWAGRDFIQDFSRVEGDKIDLSAIDANMAATLNQAFTFIGTSAFSGVRGQLRYEVSGSTLVVSGDINGDRVVDFGINVKGTGLTSLVGTDFIL